MEIKKLEYVEGRYNVDIGVTVDEWKAMLLDDKIFDKRSKDMIQKWYLQTGYRATCGEIFFKYKDEYPEHKSSPFNGTVLGLSKRIYSYINRFEVTNSLGKVKYWCIPFEGWYENYRTSGAFVWKLRKELVQAIDELNLFNDTIITADEELENVVITESKTEGRKIQYFTSKYERSVKNRNAAIKIHGLNCWICDFNFEKVYGEIGKDFIEVHHITPLHNINDEVVINPEKDLICVCSNCHRMLHRRKIEALSPSELKILLNK